MEGRVQLSDVHLHVQLDLSGHCTSRKEPLLLGSQRLVRKRHCSLPRCRGVADRPFSGWRRDCIAWPDFWPPHNHVRNVPRRTRRLSPRSTHTTRLPHWLPPSPLTHGRLPLWPHGRSHLHGDLQRRILLLHHCRLRLSRSMSHWHDVHIRHSRRPGLARRRRHAQDQQRDQRRASQVRHGAVVPRRQRVRRLLQLEVL